MPDYWKARSASLQGHDKDISPAHRTSWWVNNKVALTGEGVFFFSIPLMIKGKHSGEFCRLQARISILCRCWGEMACFGKRMIHTLPIPAAPRRRLALSDGSVSSHAYFHLTEGLWDSNILQLSCLYTETHFTAPADLSLSRFRAPSGPIHLPGTQNIDITLLK